MAPTALKVSTMPGLTIRSTAEPTMRPASAPPQYQGMKAPATSAVTPSTLFSCI